MVLTNEQIYTYAMRLAQINFNEVILPVKANFYLIKNKNLLIELAQEIDKSRESILNQYGHLSEDNAQYIIEPNKKEEAQKALNELLNLSQEVQIYKVPLGIFTNENIMTHAQMEAIMFMIEE